jgi:dynein heavy chain, axonemal
MMIPDYTLIAVVLLYSYGFKDAKNLARKIIDNNRLCSQHLSLQDHYDFGMRAVHSVVKTSSNLRLKYPNEK